MAAPIAWSVEGREAVSEAAAVAARAFEPEYREAWSAAQMAALFEGGEAWLHCGREGARLAAFALCRRVGEDMELLLCAICEARRGEGLGRALLGQVAREGGRRGARRILLEVRETNRRAINLYVSNGFKRLGTRPGYYRTMSGGSIDAVTFALDLAPMAGAMAQTPLGASLASPAAG